MPTVPDCLNCGKEIVTRVGRGLCRRCWDDTVIRSKYSPVAPWGSKQSAVIGNKAMRKLKAERKQPTEASSFAHAEKELETEAARLELDVDAREQLAERQRAERVEADRVRGEKQRQRTAWASEYSPVTGDA